MSKKSTNDKIIGELDPKYWVQKCDPLMLMRTVPFSLGELKILDTYISRINTADDSCTTVIFTKDEYERLMGLACVDSRTLKKNTKGLLGKIVELEMPNNGYFQFVLFDSAYYHIDEYGRAVVELSCSEKAKDLFFCIGKYRYFKYALRNIINLTRKASYLLFLHILANRHRGIWSTDLDELRDRVLDLKNQESYKAYKIFRSRVLEPAVKEVNAKTDCHFEYAAVKRGRKVVKIRFLYFAEESQKAIPKDTTFRSWQDDGELWEEAVKDFSFSKEQIEEIRSILQVLPDEKLPLTHIPNAESITLRRYHYMAQQAARLRRYGAGGRIKNTYAYFLQMIKIDSET